MMDVVKQHPDSQIIDYATKGRMLQILVSYDQDSFIDWENGTCISTMTGHNSWVKCLIQLLNGYIASGADDKTIKIWDNNNCIKTFYGHKKFLKRMRAR